MSGRYASSWRLPGFWEEVRGARNLYEDSRSIASLSKPSAFSKAIVLVPGFLATSTPYLVLGKFLNELGYGVYFPDFGGPNIQDRATGVLAVEEAVKKAKKRFLSVVLVGHSLGGIQILRHAQDPAVECLIVMGSPLVYGTPWRMLSKLVLACLVARGMFARSRAYFDLEEGVQASMLEDIVGAAKPYATKIYSISLTTDPIAPPLPAQFPGGHNTVIRPEKKMLQTLSARDRGYYTHGGMVNLSEVQEAIKNILI